MAASSIFVVGPEGSGTTLLWRCLAAHPELGEMRAQIAPPRRRRVAATGVLMHLSLPTLRPMLWVAPENLPRGARVVMVHRSPVHTVYSAYRRFHDDPAEAWRTYFRAARLDERYIAAHEPWCVQYEALVAKPASVLRGLYEWLGVRGDFLPRIKIRTRNDERWRTDEAFAGFMHGAFGDIDAAADIDAALAARQVPARRRAGARSRPVLDGEADRHSVAVDGDAGSDGHGPPRLMPARYLRIDDMLTPGEHAQLLEYARGRQADFAAASIIGGDGKFQVDSEFRRAATISDLDGIWTMFDSRLRRLLPYVRCELDLAWFPLGRIERQMAVHADGGFFRPHTDSADPAVAGRCITCVYYFHSRPKRFSGGELRLYDTLLRGARRERAEKYVSVDPPANTAIFFASDLYHAVCPVQRQSDAFADSRFSLNVWFLDRRVS